ncbi:hypothetical protein DAPPUDRAFT_322614 [Daphnia pulex]|uniref:Uncharacterized protein n=1 Tax=Daphnia pulex TaxID=6669 RepID=E9GWJ1_DAPPU|nr:hypothetical protein DAPPUDRAFT_322614 [Daphnia pulex]|eukprot:EFX76177.1 hypothetical protein DAPPUDRAFT_322614 [Daphnia pulex]
MPIPDIFPSEQQTPEDKKTCNLISKHQYKKQFKELTKGKAELSNEFKSTSDSDFVPPRRNEQLKPDDLIFLSVTQECIQYLERTCTRTAVTGGVSTVNNHHTEIAGLEHEILVVEMGAEKNVIIEAITSDKSDDEKECPVTAVANIIHIGHIRKRRRRTTEVEVIGTCRSVNAIVKWSLPVDEDSQSSGTAVLGVIAVKEPDEPDDAAPVSSRHIPQDIPLDVATHPSSERESASPVVYVLDDPAVFTQSCNGFSSV